MKTTLLAVSLLASVLSGCVTTQSISAADRAGVTSVVLANVVAVPERMYYLGPGGATGLMFGAIGGALAAPGIEESRAAFQKQAADGEDAIRAIVAEEVRAKVRESGKFPLVDSAGPDSKTLHVAVLQYGFSIPNGFSSNLVPILHIQCELKDGAGRVLWRGVDRALTLGNPVEAVDAETIQKDATARNAAWRGAARALAKTIVDGYQ